METCRIRRTRFAGFTVHGIAAQCPAAFLFAVLLATPLIGQGEAYYFATAGIGSGDESFVDRWCGPDMLPYTDDDIALPQRGNIGGTLGFSWIDADGDGALGEEERIFAVIRRGEDDAHTFSTRSYPQYGVLAESEDWVDYHEARNRGPSATVLGDPEAEGDDFEHNDRAGRGEEDWEDASNTFWYNHSRADERGWGGSRYHFEQRNGAGLDEIEGFNKWLTFETNRDDPETTLNERGSCDNSYMRSLDAVRKGFLIPIEEIPSLEDGELDELFGWYEGDMATYVRDVLGPKLAAAESNSELTVVQDDSGCSTTGLPATHLLILQIECPITINSSGDCPDQATAEAQAAYWGIEPIVPGSPETDAVYRASHVLLLNDDLTRVDLGVPSFTTAPEDGVARQLWVQDDFWRSSSVHVGQYRLGGPWSIVDDLTSSRGCGEPDKHFQLSGTSPGYFEAPLSAALDPAEGDIVVVAEVAEAEVPLVGDPPIAGLVPFHQMILLEKGAVVAYAELSAEGSSLHIGGTLDADGLAGSPASTAEGLEAEIPTLDPLATAFTRFVLVAGPAGIKLLQALSEDYTANVYEGLDGYEVLASSAAGIASAEIDAVRFATSGSEALNAVVDGFAVFSNLEPSVAAGNFQRGDTNNDGDIDLSDGIFLLNHLFLGEERWVCDEAANINDDDAEPDISDAVFLFGALFVGTEAPPAPYPDCGPDPEGPTCPESFCNQG